MYAQFETETSFKYLKEVIANLSEPICILGGWAVFFQANRRFQDAQGRPYLGSRDIDLGFSMSNSALRDSMSVLIDKLKFKAQSFRLYKEIHTETGKEIREGEHVPSHFTFPMYVDLIVDTIPKDFKKRFGFQPIDEPLLKNVFEKKDYVITKEFDRRLLLPKPEVLLAMKTNSLPDRDKEHKRIKDICDLFALAWYTGIDINELNLLAYTSKVKLHKCQKAISSQLLERAAQLVGHDKGEIERVLNAIF